MCCMHTRTHFTSIIKPLLVSQLLPEGKLNRFSSNFALGDIVVATGVKSVYVGKTSDKLQKVKPAFATAE